MSSKRKKNSQGYRASKIFALLNEDQDGNPNNRISRGKPKKEKSKIKTDSTEQNITDENIFPSTSSGHGIKQNVRRSSLRSAHKANPDKLASHDDEKLRTRKKRSISVAHEVSSSPAKCNKTECSSDDSIIENSPDSSLTSMAALSKKTFLKPLLDKPAEEIPHNTLKSLPTSDNDDVLLKKVAESVPISHDIINMNQDEISSDRIFLDNSQSSSLSDDDLIKNVSESAPFPLSRAKAASLSDLTIDTFTESKNIRRYNSSASVSSQLQSETKMPYNLKPVKENKPNSPELNLSRQALRSCKQGTSFQDFDENIDCMQESADYALTKVKVAESVPISHDIINMNHDEISSDRIFLDNSQSSSLSDDDLIKNVSESAPFPLSRAKAASLSDLTVDTFTESKNIRRYNSSASVSSQLQSEIKMPYNLKPVKENKPNSPELNLRRQALRSCKQGTSFQDFDENIDCMQESADYALTKVRSLSLSDLTSDDIKKCLRRCKSSPAIETFSCTSFNNDRAMFISIENELDSDDEYFPPDMLNELSDSSTAIEFSDEEHSHGDLNNRKRRKKAKSSEWKKNKAKDSRMKGEAYLGYRRQKGETPKHDTPRPARQLGEACQSDFCRKSKLRGCSEIDEETRKNIHKHFWKNLNWDQRKIYVLSLVKRSITGRKTIKTGNSRRTGTLQYFLPLDKNNEQKVQVCREMFLSTLSLGSFTVQQWVKNGEYGMSPNQVVVNTSKPPKRILKNEIKLQHLNTFFDKIPKLPSHYARKETTKLYLEPTFQTIRELYRCYISYCTEEDLPAVCRYTFEEKFHAKNLALHTLKKDKCDTCCEYEVGNLKEEDYQVHIIKKERARKEKTDDKNKADKKEAIVLTMDLEAVKSCPFLTASALYFKTKLVCHNFTVYNLRNRHCTCYWFNETAADLTASTFASCLVDYLERHCLPSKLPIIIFSDGCTYQNRNTVMANALLDLSKKHGVVITQKYLEPGHTQMECDSVHSNVEIKLKNREIHLPSDYATVTKEIRKEQPYEVIQMDYDFVKDYANPKTWSYKSIRPGRKTGEPQVVDIRAIRYNPDSSIQVKLDFDSEWMDLPQKSFALRQTVYANLHSAPIPIKLTKFNHLQQLKSVLPRDCHYFYDNLPHRID